MFTRKIRGFGTRRSWRKYIVVAGPLAVVAIAAIVLLPAMHQSARAAAPQGGAAGGCFSTSGPVCTFQGNQAAADFQSFSSDGCTATDAFIASVESVTRPGNVTGQFVNVGIEAFNICTGAPVVLASNEDFTGTIAFGGSLSTATVSGTATMFDKVSGNTFTLTVNVTWQGFGPTTREIDSSHFHAPDQIYATRFNGTSRAGDASGSLSDGTTNFAASPTLNAELMNATSGTLQITAP